MTNPVKGGGARPTGRTGIQQMNLVTQQVALGLDSSVALQTMPAEQSEEGEGK